MIFDLFLSESKQNIINTLKTLRKFSEGLIDKDKMTDVLFIGHGSPMNGISHNQFSDYWKKLGKEIDQPIAVLVISAHWYTNGTRVTAMDFPETIHDFGGFPSALYQINYPAPGNPGLAQDIKTLITSAITLDHEWGLDHGTWCVVRHMYPEANIPVIQLSIDYNKSASEHYQLAKELQSLRKKGVLIIGSGNMVHNLGRVAWDKLSDASYGYDWTLEMNEKFKSLILNEDHQKLIQFERLGEGARLAIPTPEHYLPLLYTLGLKQKGESVSIFNDVAIGGSITMTSFRLG